MRKGGRKTSTSERLTVLSAQETVEDLLHYDRVEFDQLGESLDDFTLRKKNQQTQ